jgi:branched-chain amino acid aminotransferase
MTASYLENEIIRTVKKSNLEKLCRVRLQIYAGSGGLYDNRKPVPNFIIECFHLEPSSIQLNENGLQVGIAKGLKKSKDMLSNLKTTNALIYTIAAQEAIANRWNDALICNTDGYIIESTIANVFWVKDQKVYTPPLSSGCIAGVMRNYLVSNLSQLGIDVIEKGLSIGEALAADELFLTNAIKRIKWIATFENKFYINDFTRHINKTLF